MTAEPRVTQYTVCELPEDNINHGSYALTVAYRGANRWAILHHGFCLGADGAWDYESIPSERRDDWLAAHRFDEETALRLAVEAAPDVTVNGISAREVADRFGGWR